MTYLAKRSITFLTFMMLVACLGMPNQAQDNRIVYGLTLSVSGIDPHINRSTELGIVLRQVYDTLVYRHPDTREFVPGLAQAWDISEDGLVYTFELREDVVFHDGTPFTAEAIAANFSRIFASETASQRSRFLLGPMTSYQVVDPYTFRITLSTPFTPLLDALSQVYLGIASPTALAEFADAPLRYQFHQVGTGPFEFVEYVPEDRIVIRRNQNYAWGPDFYGDLPDNAIEEIEFRFFRDPATRLLSLENGNAQIMGELSPLDARNAAGRTDVALLPTEIAGQPLQFYFNTQLAPTDDVRVRQALTYAINRTAIVEAVYQGFSPQGWGPLSTSTQYYNRGVEGVYDYNIEQAETLLAVAGYTDTDEDGILDFAGEPLQITLVQPPWGLLPQVTQLLRDQWAFIGVETTILPVPGYTALLETRANDDYNLISFDQPGLDPYILNQAFLSNSGDNWANYSNPELDRVLLEAMQLPEGEERRLAYGQAQAIIMQDAVVLPIRNYVNLNAHTANINGLRYDPYGWFPLLYGVALN